MILVTGARGQIGSDLVEALRQRHGAAQILETDLTPPSPPVDTASPFEVLDVTDAERLDALVQQYDVHTIYHLASLLSATGEQHPDKCWHVNVNGLRHVLNAAQTHDLKVFWPSSIAVFGPKTPKYNTPQTTVEDPATMYGITKVTGEMLCRYYAHRSGVDVRSLRLPGIISYSAPPGGGTTDYAVEIFHEALQHGTYTCFVRPDTRLPMMYMPDTIKAILDLMDAPPEAIRVRSSYNVAAVSFSAEELVDALQQHLPDFTCTYAPDYRQAIADSWPSAIDDHRAREDWGWQHTYDLPTLVEDMLDHLAPRGVPEDQEQEEPL
jgi:nucleoside-diphosphate-sugar epimerase